MARSFAAIFASIAMSTSILRGLLLDRLAPEILMEGLTVFVLAAFVGYGIGFAGDKTVSESTENRFRRDMANIHKAARKDIASKNPESP